MHGSVIPQLKKRGRRPVSMSPYRKTKLSPDAKIIMALLKKQPQTRDELIRNAHVSRSGFYENSALLKEKGYIIETEDGYALWTFSELEKTVEDALFRLIEKGYRITVEDLTNEAGRPWLEIETVTHAILKKYGLRIKTVNQKRFIDGWYGRKELHSENTHFRRPQGRAETLAYVEPNLERKVGEVVEELRREFKFFKEPTDKDVAVSVGQTPETMRPILFELAPKIGWKEQEECEAEKEAEEAINLAGWLRWLGKIEEEKFEEISRMVEVEETKRMAEMNTLQIRLIFREKIEEINRLAEEEIKKASNGVFIRAKRILKEFPELTPDAKLTPTGARLKEWPEETKRVWHRVFGSEPPVPTRRVKKVERL